MKQKYSKNKAMWVAKVVDPIQFSQRNKPKVASWELGPYVVLRICLFPFLKWESTRRKKGKREIQMKIKKINLNLINYFCTLY